MTHPPYLTLVDGNTQTNDDEFFPLPYYPWDERPHTVALEHDEAATALHLARGDLEGASKLLKVSTVRLHRLVRRSPRLQRVLDEAFQLTLIKAASVPIQTLFDSSADARRLEWASTKVLQSKLAQGHPLSPAPAGASASTSVTVNSGAKTLTFRWRTPEDAGSTVIDGDE